MTAIEFRILFLNVLFVVVIEQYINNVALHGITANN